MSDTNTTQPTVALALGSGAARGAAHIGVLEVLEETGIDISLIAGTSAGALIGGAYAAGMTPTEIRTVVTAARWSTFGKVNPGRRMSLFDTRPQQQAIAEHLGSMLIEDLPRRFAAVAYDLRSRKRVLLTTGSLSSAMQASMAVPGLFPPVEIDGQLLIDGSIIEPVPVIAATSLSKDQVIAVSVGASDKAAGPLARSLERTATLFGIETRTGAIANADLLIEPATADLASWSHRDVPAIIEAGRQATTEALTSLDLSG